MCYFAGVDDPIPMPRCNGETIVAGKRQALISFFSKKSPARRPVRIRNSFGDLEGYVAVAAYYVDLLGRPDDGPALGANVLDAAVLAGAASATLYGDRGFLAVIVIIVALDLDLEGSLAVRGDVAQFRLLGDPGSGFRRQIRYRPSVGVVVADGQAVGFGGLLEFLVVVVSVVGYVLDPVGEVVEVGHLVQHRGGHVADRAIDVLGADVDFPVRLAVSLPDFVYGAPAIGSASPIRRYRDSRAGQLARVEMVVKEVEHLLGFGYDLGNTKHWWCLLECYV